MKLPAFQFYTGDWLKDPQLSMCSPSTRGIWVDLLCAMHELGRCGQVTGTVEQICRPCRCTSAEMSAALAELDSTKTAIVSERNGFVTVTCRRMNREYKERIATNSRVRKHRGSPDVTEEKRRSNNPSSSSSSTSTTKKDSRRGADAPLKKPSVIWDLGVTMLVNSGWTEPNARSFIGKQAKEYGEKALAQAISVVSSKNPANPHEYLVKTLQEQHGTNGRQNGASKVGPRTAILESRDYTVFEHPKREAS